MPDNWPAAVLWDMDGTLVDSEPYWMETEFELAAAFGGTWSEEHGLSLVGNNLPDAGRYIQKHMGIDLTPEAIVEWLLDGVVTRIERVVPWRPGALELLSALVEEGVPCGLVTMSYQRFVAPVLSALPEGTFSEVVTGDAVERGKPHPEPYLTAAARLGVDPTHCVAIEDSHHGAQSAESAGCTVVVLPNQVPVPGSPSRVFADSFADVSPAWLRSLRG